jgi:hypothetical protein
MTTARWRVFLISVAVLLLVAVVSPRLIASWQAGHFGTVYVLLFFLLLPVIVVALGLRQADQLRMPGQNPTKSKWMVGIFIFGILALLFSGTTLWVSHSWNSGLQVLSSLFTCSIAVSYWYKATLKL